MPPTSPLRHGLRVAALLALAGTGRIAAAQDSLPGPAPGWVHQQWTARDGLPVDGLTDVLQTRDGYLWIATWDGLVRFDGVRFAVFHLGNTAALPGNRVTGLYELPDGRLRVLTALPGGIVDYRAGAFTRPFGDLPGAPAAMYAVARAPGGAMWVRSDVGWYRVPDDPAGTLQRIADPTGGRPLPAARAASGSDGWSVDGAALRRDGRDVFRASSPIVRHVVDREGNVWLATYSTGLHRIRRAEVSNVVLPGPAAARRTHAVLEGAAGTIWIATSVGRVARARDGRVAVVDSVGLLDWLGTDAAGRVRAGTVVVDAGGALPDDATARAVAAERGRAFLGMFEDRGGARWFPRAAGGVSRLAGGRWTHFGTADGLPAAPIRSIHQTRDGAIWLLTHGGGLRRFQDGRFECLTTAEGLASDFVRGFHEDDAGIVWLGSFGFGLTRLDRAGAASLAGARLHRIRSSDGLADDVVHQILEDDVGRLWIGSNRGIFSVRRADLDALAAGRLARVPSVRYDEAHGMRSREVNGGGFPAGLRSRDGRLWFPTQDGVAVVDPRALPVLPDPRVLIERLAVGDSLLSLADTVRLSPGRRDLEVGYTAPSFVRAEHLRFRYRLEGWDARWVDAGTRRSAFFTNLPPGRYAFHVAATAGVGRWVEATTPLAVVVPPRVHETTWFRVAAAILAVLALTAAATWRARAAAAAAAARAAELERMVQARTAELAREKEVTARQAASLAELDRAKDRFFANISHEFRTPLTLILGLLTDLVEGRNGTLPPAVRAHHAMMQRNAQRLLRLVNQVLDLTRLESGQLALDLVPVDLVSTCRATVESFAPLAERRRIALAFEAAPAAVPVRLDPPQFEKVLLNLLSNAFKFTEPGGRVEVRVEAAADGDGRVAQLVVRDTGMGIAPDLLPRVFDRFFQADGSATRRHEGSGIGLSLARELVELHGGTIGADSVPGVGSSFTVRLPLHGKPIAPVAIDPPSDHLTLPPATTSEASDDGAGLTSDGDARGGEADAERTTVLVVDDNADVRAYVRTVLAPSYRVLEAEDGEAGLACAREALPDLVLADVMMPRLDGFALARALRDDPATDCIPVVLLTARAGPGDEVAGLATGADDYVTKPFDRAVLEARVGNLIAARRRLRERYRQEGLPAPAPAEGTLQSGPLGETAPAAVREPSELERRLRLLVEARLTEPELNPEALAAAAGLSYQQLYRRLRDELGATPSQFIRTVRVERAAELLRAGEGSVTEVAYAVGFNALSHFHRSFRERFGVAPTALVKARS